MNNIISAIEKYKFIAILRNIDKDKLIPLTSALYNAGVKLVEVPFSEPASEETTEKIKMLAEEFKGRMYIGAGTVLTPRQVRLTKLSGGSFIISPDAKEAVIRETKALGMVSIPGVYTPTEITLAMDSGADFVKLFPAGVGAAEFIKAVKAPLKNAKIIAVGGVNHENLSSFINAGAVAVGVGSNIANKALIEKGDFEAITENALKYTKQL